MADMRTCSTLKDMLLSDEGPVNVRMGGRSYSTGTERFMDSLLYQLLFESMMFEDPVFDGSCHHLTDGCMRFMEDTEVEVVKDDRTSFNEKLYVRVETAGQYGTGTAARAAGKSFTGLLATALSDCRQATVHRPIIYVIGDRGLAASFGGEVRVLRPKAAFVVEPSKVAVYLGRQNLPEAWKRFRYLKACESTREGR